MKARVVLVVITAWVLIGLVQGAQATVGASLQGGDLPLREALFASLLQAVPWIPITLAVIALAIRFPVSRSNWRSRIPIHLAGALAMAFVANVFDVASFGLLSGTWGGWTSLVSQAARWAVIGLHIAVVTYAAIAFVTQTVMSRRAARQRELHLARVEGQLAQARLQALTSQIRPHFLFNTLHTIGQLWREGRSEEADALLDHLGTLFQGVQRTTSRTEVPLDEELDMVRDYLAIEEARFRDRLTVRIDADPDALERAVPPLILQPIVENAVRHGISAASSAGAIEIHASIAEGRLRLVVSDDGPGMREPSAQAGSGMGLRNVRERLAQLYGERGTLSIDSADSAGTTVRIEIPLSRVRADARVHPERTAVVG